MAIYRYQHGDRPLEGFTIQHGLGRGGFGEVYYAVSDSGREVALKSVQNYEDIELRGISHCMNLKSPQLVSIFDIKHNSEGLPFVIMEYVDGPSLRQILDTHPEGLGTAKAAFFLREIGKGLNYLHDCGVVHRDLKPHNVFYEQGVVKIGDYSLSKVISTSHRSGHTLTVGTVHYMAPEISMGRYDHTVDIYALGVLLYEMLTGHPPFIGDSMGEVLMKHVAGNVDLSGIDEPFRHVIAKALAKEPEQRYQTAQDMVDDLFGHAQVQDSVAALGPESLTIVAEHALRASADSPPPLPKAAQPTPAETTPAPARQQSVEDRPRTAPKRQRHRHWKQLVEQGWSEQFGPVRDPLSAGKRFWLVALSFPAMVMALIVCSESGVFPRHLMHGDAIPFGVCTLAIGTVLSLVTQNVILKKVPPDSNMTFRVMHGLIVSLGLFPLGLAMTRMTPAVIGVCASMFVLAWRAMASPLRPSRVCIELLIWPAVAAGIVTILLGGAGYAPIAVAAVAGIALLVQLGSPCDPELVKRLGGQYKGNVRAPETPEPAPHAAAPEPVMAAYAAEKPVEQPAPQVVQAAVSPLTESDVAPAGRVSPYSRLFALVLSVLFFPFGIAGLQRFYVGRVASGFVWLITFGVFGIGQIIDVIMIALGQFNDADGKRVLAFNKEASQIIKPVNEYSAVVRDTWTESRIGFKLGNLFLNLVGGILMVASLVLGSALAVGLPQALAVGVFGQEVAREVARETGIHDWYIIVNNVLAFLLVIIGTLAAASLLFARRHTTMKHMARVPVAILGLVTAVSALGMSTEFGNKWHRVAGYVDQQLIGEALAKLFNQGFWPCLIFACVAFVISMFILAWPARRLEVPTATPAAASVQARSHEKQTV